MSTWNQPTITALLDLAESSLRECVTNLSLPATILRKERAVGIIPSAPGYRFARESLEETVLVVQKKLEMSVVGKQLPFCAFNGGNDVFVDIGDKSWGVLVCQKVFGDEVCFIVSIRREDIEVKYGREFGIFKLDFYQNVEHSNANSLPPLSSSTFPISTFLQCSTKPRTSTPPTPFNLSPHLNILSPCHSLSFKISHKPEISILLKPTNTFLPLKGSKSHPRKSHPPRRRSISLRWLKRFQSSSCRYDGVDS